MEISLLKKTENALEIEVKGENETLLNLLKQHLLKSEKVVSATYLMGHPFLDNPKLYLEVKGGKPEAQLKQAAKELRTLFDELETQVIRATSK
ncbi:MAG TPA: RpoL/Rpb11 RNA polymerase subunit family protein [Candidatus Thermoplasmatota archaeon]|nr:RpoL/Rpb11 RNA polymerase subunit family protein [Candidatus Thermoplasmatota archaeon]